jgi:hypothetical protein
MRRSFLVVVVAGLMAGCAGEPSSPSPSDDPFVVQAASFGSLFTIEPRRINIECSLNQPCGLQVTITSSRPVTLDWGMETLGVVFNGPQPCPIGTYFFGSCALDLLVPDTSQPGRFGGTLTVGDLDTGVSKTFRVTVRVR